MMNSNFKMALVALPVAIGLCAFTIVGSRCAAAFTKPVNASQKEQTILERSLELLKETHYSPLTIDDSFSHKVFDLFLERSDYNKKIFLQSDIDELKKYYSQIDDQSKAGSFEFFDRTIELLNQRIAEDTAYYTEILNQPFDFTTKESVELDPKKIPYAKDKAEMKDAWRKYLKYLTLIRFVDLKEEQEKAAASADKKPDFVAKTDVELEKDARAKVKKMQSDYFERLKKFDRDDRMAMFMNVVTGSYDPHTEFFPPKDKENFDIQMSGQLEGIGATLQEKDGYIKVMSIVPGSPSWKQGQLKAGDLIIKVAQGDKEPVDVVGMKVDDAVKIIRGKKGTEVRLTVKKPDGSSIIIPIVRDIVILEETFAQSAVIEQNQKVGYIRLPSFYADFTKNKSGGHFAAEDVRQEILKLKSEKISGLILDLRDNGGGSLAEVVKMVGLFIPKGPVVQVKTRTNGISMHDDRDNGEVVYDGPLVVMINENSASASEILAAAIQDYKRGVIVGGNSFGKGTVQNFFDLDDSRIYGSSPSPEPLGAVKVTIQKFYRINGGSTQLKGVAPDIAFPDLFGQLDEGEQDLDFPLPWDQISSADYSPLPSPDYAKLKKNSARRITESKEFQLVSNKAEQLKREKDQTLESLFLDDYLASRKKIEEENKAFKALDEPVKGMKAIALSSDLASIKGDTTRTARKEDWISKIGKDIYINEASNIIGDMK